MLPFTTTTVKVEPKRTGTVKYEGVQYDSPTTGTPAVISNLTPRGRYIAGNGQTVTARMHVDLGANVPIGARVTDEISGAVYEIVDQHDRYEFGIDYTACGLVRFEGRSF